MTVPRLSVLLFAGCLTAVAEEPPRKVPSDAGAPDGGKVQLLPPNIGKGQLLSDVTQPPHRPRLPDELKTAGMVVWGIYKVCVKTDGTVAEVKVIKSADWRVDPSWMTTVKGWRYRPYTIGGKPVPFCYPMRLEVRAAR